MLDKFKQIKTFVFDVDGVLTDGTLYIFDSGEQVRRMNIRDGFALQLAIKKGYRILIISGGDSPAVKLRLNKLGISDVFLKVKDKPAVLEEYILRHNLNKAGILFMGDDIPDYEVMKMAGLPCAPADAAPDIKAIAAYISAFNGGMGCVRDVIEKVLKLNNDWELHSGIRSK